MMERLICYLNKKYSQRDPDVKIRWGLWLLITLTVGFIISAIFELMWLEWIGSIVCLISAICFAGLSVINYSEGPKLRWRKVGRG